MNFAQWVAILNPAVFVMENVKGLLSRRNSDGEKVINIISRTFKELGYFVEIWVLNSANYGVPQIRERIIIVGHRHSRSIGIPPVTHSLIASVKGQSSLLEEENLEAALTLWDAISDLPEIEAGAGQEEQEYISAPNVPYQNWARLDSNALYNHVAMCHSRRLVERFKHIKWGQSGSDVPEHHSSRRRNGSGALSDVQYDQNNRRLNPYKPSHTIAAAFYANFVHPFQHRNLTAREGARVQSFPDRYRFLGKKTVVSHKLLQREERFDEKYLCQYNQIGNAIPPLLSKAIATHIKEILQC